MPRAFDVMILSVFHRTISCLHVGFECFKFNSTRGQLLQFETPVYELLKLFDSSRR